MVFPTEVRIRTWITPDLHSGLWRFRDTPGTRLLVRQLRMFPVADHDDGPDAVASARELAVVLCNDKVEQQRRGPGGDGPAKPESGRACERRPPDRA